MEVVLEVGPATVRRLDRDVVGSRGATNDCGTVHHDTAVSAALDAIDDPVALVGERPVDIDGLWRHVLRSLIDGRCESLTIVHPSWWPRRRVDVVVRAARTMADQVAPVARRDLVGRAVSEVLIETGTESGADVIAVTNGWDTAVHLRTDFARTVEVAAGWAGDGPVYFDVLCDPDIRGAFGARGLPTVDVDVAAFAHAAARSDPPAIRRRVHRVGWRNAVAVAVVTLAAIALCLVDFHSSPGSASLVEGRIAVEIPATWTVQRITGGPGSRRVQVTSPSDPETALHITQTYAPGNSLEEAAAVLGRAIVGQAPEVFVDFQSHGEAAGRSAVTYREVRAGRVIYWSVVLAGATRISIGCQSPTGREEAVREACDRALGSAREIVGTETAAEPSN